ncbi:hypothetical protein [Fimbriiglobus ruber]|uniref:Uncharacterized protein n=1 Tax=Fimbriiglobus ruber TaxID=1908690 RepID=A0A225DD40_9BACT|nr:hypothetical protein [Fimbriiglobus ruber]OWK34325.1 hypothetical protein FRUB_10296 [Fimbriiglobus ruber]
MPRFVLQPHVPSTIVGRTVPVEAEQFRPGDIDQAARYKILAAPHEGQVVYVCPFADRALTAGDWLVDFEAWYGATARVVYTGGEFGAMFQTVAEYE